MLIKVYIYVLISNQIAMLKRILFLLTIVLLVASCKKEVYQLKWKMPDGEVLIYSIQMETIDSLSSVTEENMRVLVDMVAKMYGDSIDVPPSSSDLYQGLVRQLNMLSYFSILRYGSDKNVKIDFITRQVKEYEQIKYLDIFNKFVRKAYFKGSLTSNGSLISETGGPVFDPKINILFELPEKPVGIGDSWSLNVRPPAHAIDKSQLDSILNKVTFKDLIVQDNDSIAILDYKLQSPDKSGNVIRFTGRVKFSINHGKWLEYTGVLSQKTSGLLPMNHVQKIKLSEITVEKYKSIIKQAQKGDLFGDQKMGEDPVETNGNETSQTAGCPEVFRVQLLAAQHPLSNPKVEFKNIPYPVDEVIPNPAEKFKYKYTVGKDCERAKAELLLGKIKALGYSKAYIIKTKEK
jgi:hypothetical protein